MKANELMIDDWVYNKNIDKPMQVYPTMFSQMFRQRPDAPTEDYNIFPIRITPEILEKNGFRETDVVVVGTRKMRWESEDGRTEITIWMDYTMPMEIRKNIYYEDEVCYALPFAWAVHQLQHAMRLCGIEKEIEL